MHALLTLRPKGSSINYVTVLYQAFCDSITKAVHSTDTTVKMRKTVTVYPTFSKR